MNTSIHERFHQFIKKHIGSMQLAADALDTSIRHISEACNGKTDITVKDIYYLIKDYSLNVNWLLFGKGNELNRSKGNEIVFESIDTIALKLISVEAKIKLQDKQIKELMNKAK